MTPGRGVGMSLVVAMAWFKGRLYVGTARDPLCVELATMAFYFPAGGYYRPQPARDLRCPPAIGDADLRAEIWRYTPRSGRWARVYRSPRIAGTGMARDIGYRGMAVLKEPGRPAALYVAGVTAGEFAPEIRRRNPPRLLRTTDGARFRALRGGPGRHPRPRRRPAAGGYRAMAVLDGELYVTASGGLTGDGVVLRVRDPAGRAPRFEQVSPAGLAVFELQPFAGRLYAGTGDGRNGYGVCGGWAAAGVRAGSRWSPAAPAAGDGDVGRVDGTRTDGGGCTPAASGWGPAVFPASELIRVSARRRLGGRGGQPRALTADGGLTGRRSAGSPTASATRSTCTSGACRPTAARCWSG